MKSSSHSLSGRERPVAQSKNRHVRPMRLTGRPSSDTPPNEFGVVNLVAQHDKATHQEFSGHRHLRFLAVATMDQSLIETFQVRVCATGCLACLVEQKTEQARAFFTDTAHATALTRRVFHRVQAHVSNHLAGGTEARHRRDGVAHAQSRKQADAWMRPQQFELFVAGGHLFQDGGDAGDALVELSHQCQPLFALLAHHRRQLQGSQALLPTLAQQAPFLGQAGAQANRVQRVLGNGAYFYQLVPVAQLPQHQTTFGTEAMQLGEVPFEHQHQDQIRIAAVVLLPSWCFPSDLGWVPQPHCVLHTFQQLFEPAAVTTGLQPYDHFTLELRVELTHLAALVLQLMLVDLAISAVAITNRLLPRMKINSKVYCHWAPPFAITNPKRLECNHSRREVPVS